MARKKNQRFEFRMDEETLEVLESCKADYGFEKTAPFIRYIIRQYLFREFKAYANRSDKGSTPL